MPNKTELPAPSAAELARVFLRQKWKAAFVFVSICSLAVLACIFLPRKYASIAKLHVQVGRETATLDPTVATGQTVAVQKSHERQVNSILEIATSQQVLQQVVDSLGVPTILAKSDTKSWLSFVKSSLKAFDLDPISEDEQAIQVLKKQIEVSVVEGTDILVLRVERKSAESAQQVAEAILEAFFAEQGRLSRTSGGFEFFERQSAEQQAALQAAMSDLRDRKNEYRMLSVSGQSALLNSQLISITDQVSRAESELAYAKARSSGLSESVTLLPKTIQSETVDGVSNRATDQMRAQLYAIEIREKELAAKFSDDHPSLVQLRQQREAVNRIFEEQPEQRVQSVTSLDTNWQALQLELITEQASLTALRSKLSDLQQQQAAINKRMVELNNNAIELTELEAEVDRLSGVCELYAQREEEARISDALNREQISSIKVVQAPTLSHKPVSPQKLLTVAVGVFLAFAAAVATVLAAEYFDGSLVTEEQIQRQVGLPVLATLSVMPNRKRDVSLLRTEMQEARS